MLAPDTIIDRRYRILRPIGKGGMGAVYEVTDERLGRTLALKQMTVTGERFAQAFEQEARLLARLSHPSLPQVHDHFSDPQGQFLVMEYIPGPDLREALTAHQAPFTVEEVLRLADQLLDVLEYLHTQPEPVIHRDIKPANIKVPNGQVKLLDFGLTKGSADYVSRIRMSSLTGYTLQFAPPEQIRGKPTGPRSDLFALASTLYCLLTGVDPPDALERVFALQEGDPDLLQPATTLNAHVPQAVNDILLRAMALRYERRPASAAAMRKALREAAPALWQPGGAAWSNQGINNPASNRGAQGIFYGPVYFGQPVPDEQEAARKQAEEEERRQREQEAARKQAEEEARQRREEEAARKREEEERQRQREDHERQQLLQERWLLQWQKAHETYTQGDFVQLKTQLNMLCADIAPGEGTKKFVSYLDSYLCVEGDEFTRFAQRYVVGYLLHQRLQFVSTESTIMARQQSQALLEAFFADNSIFRVLVAGSVSTGKTTLINAILRERILPFRVTPTTAIPHKITFGEVPRAVVQVKDETGKVEYQKEISISELGDYTISLDALQGGYTADWFEYIKTTEIVVFFHLTLVAKGLNLLICQPLTKFSKEMRTPWML